MLVIDVKGTLELLKRLPLRGVLIVFIDSALDVDIDLPISRQFSAL